MARRSVDNSTRIIISFTGDAVVGDKVKTTGAGLGNEVGGLEGCADGDNEIGAGDGKLDGN